MKKLLFTQRSDRPHWVGDGFPVRSIFRYQELASELSPFLLLDYAGPTDFEPTDRKRGVGAHPHRGFETVTIVYDGEVEHRDSAGGGGAIGAGDVQWMTAAAGIVHEEFHGRNFARSGGPFEMIQLWVNLPAKDKMSPPGYQAIQAADIPLVDLPEGAGQVRVIAGAFREQAGPAATFSPINLWDLRLNAGGATEFEVPAGHTTAIFVLSGEVTVDDGATIIGPAELAVLERAGDRFYVAVREDARLLFLGGAPLEEAVVGHGPFVMNTSHEILQAFQDFEAGRMGRIEPVVTGGGEGSLP
jgi:hypothetical protein